MGQRIYLNDGWEFTEESSQAFLDMEPVENVKTVRLPHTCRETPYNYFDDKDYQMVCGYRRDLEIPAGWKGKTLLLTIEAAGHYAEVFFNGEKLAEHRCGYTSFQVDLTETANFGGENRLAVRLDTREDLDQPPFGYVIDYMTYGGLYREVWLDVKEPAYLSDVFVKPQVEKGTRSGTVRSEITLSGVEGEGYTLRQNITKGEGTAILAKGTAKLRGNTIHTRLKVGNVLLWDVDAPHLYYVTTELLRDGKVIDRNITRIGFRTAEFQADGFYLNGRKLRLRGLNRHQSYPYVGYAMPESMQRLDADILKKELGLNAVRTSHYPQSRHFIDRCDELGLLVFTEIPGWQHIGGEAWKAQAVENTKEMVLQYRNHPSIILWGVRINESLDDDSLYTETNRVAHLLDPTRPTGGVRYLQKSSLLEDVYTFNDFVHDGTAPGCRPKAEVTSDVDKPYLISEYNGHMYPTKMFDSEYHLLEHALRHARVLDAVAGEEGIAGSFGWCMFDYNTHKDFGSGDRICYHGVMDMYRNPKLAAAVYASQAQVEPVLEVSASMDIGEHPAGNIGKVYILTNADSVRMYRNDHFIKEYRPSDSAFGNLDHGPILVDDYIGDLLREEGFSKGKAELLAEILNYSAVYGFNDLPAKIKAKAAKAMAKYHMNFEDAYQLYGKYIGSWGGETTTFRFDAIQNGQVVKSVSKTPVTSLALRAEADHTVLKEETTYDVAAIRVSMCDQNGNHLRFYNGAVRMTLEGPVELIGPSLLELRGGSGGAYLKTTGQTGTAALTLETDQTEPVRLEFEVKGEKDR